MTSYTADMEKLFQLSEKKNDPLFKVKALNSRIVNSGFYRNGERCWGKLKELLKRRRREHVVVSLTSHPGRIDKVSITIESLLRQKSKPQKILLWLSKVQFPDGNAGLPKELVKLTENPDFEIRWAEDDLAPHKKYLYTVQEYPDLPVIIVDDDVIYDPTLVERLMNSYRKFPDCISCMRANFMMFRPDGTPRIYDKWIMDYKLLMDTPSYQLMPTGVGGVLYPPNALPEAAFQIDAIKKTCLYCDDLWLKMMVVYNNFRTVIPRDWCKYELIEGSQDTALWRHNVHRSNNDVSLENILNYFDETICRKDVLLGKIRQDRFC